MVNKYYMSNGNIQLSPHFTLQEFQSKNNCDVVLVDSELIDMLERIGKICKATSIVIVDGYREPGDYCHRISGMDADAHSYGLAADVIYYSGNDAIPGELICCIAQDIGCGGIGYMGRSVHLDTRANGGYKNSHWYGDETTGQTVTDWHSYFNIVDHFDIEKDKSDDEKQSIEDAGDYFNGGDMVDREITDEQLLYEVNRHALTLLGREIGDAETYVRMLKTGEIDWYEFDKRLQESEEGVKRWIDFTLFRGILGRVPDISEVNWWYSQYVLKNEMNKALMVKGFSEDYEAFFDSNK
jgi:hypothetical protein